MQWRMWIYGHDIELYYLPPAQKRPENTLLVTAFFVKPFCFFEKSFCTNYVQIL